MKIGYVFATITSLWADADIMFSDVEKEALSDVMKMMPKRGNSSQTLRLDGIIYHSEDNWKVWISGLAYDPATTPEWGRILCVRVDHVVIEQDGEEIVLVLGQSSMKSS